MLSRFRSRLSIELSSLSDVSVENASLFAEQKKVRHTRRLHVRRDISRSGKGKGKGLDTCYSVTYINGLVTSSALQSRKWQLIGMSQWCRSALCGYPLPALTDNWAHGAASRHTIAPISHTRPSPRSRSHYSFPVPLRVGG